MKLKHFRIFFLLSAASLIAEDSPKKEEPAPEDDPSEALYQAGKDLFESFAPPEIKEQYEFPDKTRWEEFATRLQRALESNDSEALVQYEPEARAVLITLKAVPGNEDYVNWLEERLDYIEAAKETPHPPPVPPQPALPPPLPSAPVKPELPAQFIPLYSLWLQRLQNRPLPTGADRLIPVLSAVFDAAGVPAELVWLAEVESTLNPNARSPVGARGLFQLMPATAKELGLSTFLPDERVDPKKSAGAAAQFLRTLHKKFGDWPLAIAAYNAGAGRVQRTLDRQKATTFAEIAPALPIETRMYVPKVLAMLQVRAGMSLANLAPPRS